MFATIDAPFWSLFVRTTQAVIEASPTLVCGLFVAGVLRRMVGGEQGEVRRPDLAWRHGRLGGDVRQHPDHHRRAGDAGLGR